MSRRQIVLTVEPTGIFTEGTADGAHSPGMVTDVKAATEPVSGRYTFDSAAATDRYVVRENGLLGGTVDDAYADGDRLFLYLPRSGDQFLALFLASEGAQAIGDEVGPNTAGKFVSTGTGYKVMETVTVGGSDTLVMVEKV